MSLTYIKRRYRIRVLLAFLSCMIFFTASMTAFAQDRKVFEQDLYADFGTILSSFVDDSGLVNYQGLKAERSDLDGFTQRLARLDSLAFDAWSENNKIAFWINAYNALTLKSIIDNYPIKPTFPARLIHPHNSIRQIPGVWDKTSQNRSRRRGIRSTASVARCRSTSSGRTRPSSNGRWLVPSSA